MMVIKYLYILFISFFIITGCSSEEDQSISEKLTSEQSNKEHFLKDQVRALEKAKGVEQMLQSGADKRKQEIEEQTAR